MIFTVVAIIFYIEMVLLTFAVAYQAGSKYRPSVLFLRSMAFPLVFIPLVLYFTFVKVRAAF